ncbi:TetR/AcrR family transcriptional regulator [Actinoallomurus rhizosphaericola]|uniref:TetR/AcrR family transcriptional regulator n=1 Tax=Actinoallomurus rhizosphaericola TaxID=2952536 RepID=UPI002092668E|nr:TetR family transcriptional regulator C-terminal domain-containing protein [Actinoallomurus rhizosphaericola]MCO5995437.1 TetR family transcriptional regulator C-terminal domain-containing protein [Actinoallomurus rhizosphaericola]
MTKLVDRPNSARGGRRREQLVAAGVALLQRDGWPGVTTRAVAEHAGARPGLIHYHFGGLPGLHAAVFRRATDLIIEPLVSELLAAPGEQAALAMMRQMMPQAPADEATARLAAELIVGAMRDPALGVVLRGELRRARALIADRLGELHPGWPPARLTGVATLITAAIDGLMLHHMIDCELPAREALSAVGELLDHEDDRGKD